LRSDGVGEGAVERGGIILVSEREREGKGRKACGNSFEGGFLGAFQVFEWFSLRGYIFSWSQGCSILITK